MGTYRMAGEGPLAKSLCSCNVRRGAPQIPSSRPPELMSIHLVLDEGIALANIEHIFKQLRHAGAISEEGKRMAPTEKKAKEDSIDKGVWK